MSKDQTKTQILTQLAMTVAALIGGGYVIFLMSSLIPLPGIKYLMMSPYLSLIIAIVMKVIRTKWVVLKINTVFAFIMILINLYMGIAIFLTGVGTQLITYLLRHFPYQIQLSAAAYSSFSVGIALIVSKVLIGGAVFELISPLWMIVATLIAYVLGLIGAISGCQVAVKVKRALNI